MLKNLFACLLFFLTLHASAEVAAQSPLTAGNRLFFTQEAHNIQTGLFSFSISGSGFTKSDDYLNPVSSKTEGLSLFSSDLTLDYGLSKHFTLSVGSTILQSTFPNEGSGTDTDYLNEMRLSGKFGSIGIFNDHLNLGLLTTIHLPIQSELNAPFVPFRSGSLDIQTQLLVSYYFDNVLPEESTSFHVNIGPKFFLSSDADFSRLDNQTALVKESQLALLYAFGLKQPIGSFDVFVELSGQMFLGNSLPDFVYSKEDLSYVGGGIKWQTFDWLQISILGHMLISGGDSDEETVFDPAIGVYKLSSSDINYTPYYLTAGLQFVFGKSYDLYDEGSFESEPSVLNDDEKTRYTKIEEIIGVNSQELVDIYFKGRKTDKKLQGSVYFDIVIAKDGSTKDARILVSTFHETNIARMVENEMLKTIKSWKYPKGDKELQIEILKMNFSSTSSRFITN